jgi:type IV pilus assembly protein PilQ
VPILKRRTSRQLCALCSLVGFLLAPEALRAGPENLQESIPQSNLDSGRYQGELVSVKLVDVSLTDFFRTISELSGLNVLIDPDVQGSLTINVEQIKWDQLFDTVLRSHGLVRSIEGNLVRISTKETLQREEESEQKLKRAAYLAEDTITVTRHLNYSNGTELAPSFQNQLTERGQIDIDQRTNTLIITDVDDSVEKILGLLESLDVPERQVEIEARIVEATTGFSRRLGVQLGLLVGTEGDRNRGGLAVLAPVTDPVGSISFSSGKALDTVRLDAVITAAESEGEARMLSRPRVSAQNNVEAKITQGSRIPVPVQQNFTTTVHYETAALQLTVTPQITSQDTVLLKIRVENSVADFNQTVLGIPTILTSESQTQVLVEDGGTTIIGGIFVEADRESEDKVPGLGDVPLLGNLFKHTTVERETREIIFFITPRIRK